MQVGSWVQWSPPQFHGIELNPLRGWVVAAEGDWRVVRVSNMKNPQAPFATFHTRELTPVSEKELVHRGAPLLA